MSEPMSDETEQTWMKVGVNAPPGAVGFWWAIASSDKTLGIVLVNREVDADRILRGHKKAALAGRLRRLIGGWREVIAELDDMPKNEALGKAMWICLDQIDEFKHVYDALDKEEA